MATKILKVMNDFHEKTFEKIVEEVIEPQKPGGSFYKAIEKFQKILNNLGYTYCPLDEDIKRPLLDIYRKVAAKKGVNVRPLVSVKETIIPFTPTTVVTPDMRRGVHGADLIHRKKLGKDY